MIDVLIGVCDIAQIQDADVCSGLLTAEGPAVHHALQNMHVGSHASKTLCASLVGLCDYPEVREYDLALSPKPPKTRPPPSGQPPIRVAHISDTHVDLSYETGSNYDCSKPICCRVYTEEDAPGNTSSPCGPFGNPKCDPPLRLEESMVEAIEELNPAFSIYTGDVVAHDIWMVNRTEVLDDFNATYSLLDRLGLVYAAVGNHDTAPVNLFPASEIPASHDSMDWAYQALSSAWHGLAPIDTADRGSYSSIVPGKNLKIISYNSIFYYTNNFYMYTDPMALDPDSQFTWLIDELAAAEAANQRVWLIAHIPSGSADHFRDYSHYFDQIVTRYEATIAALFFGHTHTDLFQLSYTDYTDRSHSTAAATGYITPSLTPTSGPPSFRIYDIDPITFAVLDYTVYTTNTSTSVQTGPSWAKYYSAKESYGALLSPAYTEPTAELTPAFWHNVTALMEADDSVFQAWWARRKRGFDVSECTGDCVAAEICKLRGADALFNCVQATPGLHLKKRVDGEGCDERGVGVLLARLMGSGAVSRS